MHKNIVQLVFYHGRDVLAGALLGRLLSLWAPLVIGPLAIYPANVSIILLAMLAAIQRVRPQMDRLWRVIMGVSLDGAVFLLIKEAYDYYSFPSIVGALALLTAYTVLTPLREQLVNSSNQSVERAHFKVWVSLATAAFIIVWMRVTYLAVVNIPNDERSFYVFGHEFHHIMMGFTGLLLLDRSPHPSTTKGMIAFAIIHGMMTGWIFDQALFFTMPGLDDQAYQHPLSLFGAIGTLVAATLITVVIVRSTKSAMVADRYVRFR